MKIVNKGIKVRIYPNNITITYDNGRYYAILNIESPVNEWSQTDKIRGFDLNSNRNYFLVSSTGDKYHFDVNHENQMIKKLNKTLSTKEKGSRAFNRIKNRLHKWYDKRTNTLNDYIQKLSIALVKKLDTIVIENNWSSIKILIGGEQNMIFPTLRFKEMLEYKFKWFEPVVMVL